MDCGNDGTEGKCQVTRICLGGRVARVDRDLVNKGVLAEVVGKIADYVTGRMIYEMCTGVERMEGSNRFL